MFSPSFIIAITLFLERFITPLDIIFIYYADATLDYLLPSSTGHFTLADFQIFHYAEITLFD
jgi:hypothetical protein